MFPFSSTLLILLFLFQYQHLHACMIDDDCRQSEQCFKREKNAYGICIRLADTKDNKRNSGKQPKILEIEGKQQAIDFFGTPEENLRSISPDGKIGRNCHSTEDCDPTEECVIAGFEGRCLQLK